MRKRLHTPQVPMGTPQQRAAAVRREKRRRLAAIAARVQRLERTHREQTRQRNRRRAAEIIASVFNRTFAGTKSAAPKQTNAPTRGTTKGK